MQKKNKWQKVGYNINFWTTIIILLFFFSSCAPQGKLFKWCKKRDFPAICKKIL